MRIQTMSAAILFFLLGHVMFILKVTNGAEFAQRDYHIVSDHIAMDKLDVETSSVSVTNTKYNRTQRTFGLKLNLKKPVHPTKLLVRVQAYRFMSNVYKLFAPIKLTFNICDAMTKNSFGVGDFRNKYGNATDCPIQPGVYVIHDYVPDEDKMPPYIPEGKYRIALEILSDTTSLGAISWYGAIVKRKKF